MGNGHQEGGEAEGSEAGGSLEVSTLRSKLDQNSCKYYLFFIIERMILVKATSLISLKHCLVIKKE